MKYIFGLLVLGLLAGCTHVSIDEGAAYTQQWSGRPVGDFMEAHSMGSTTELLRDATSGIPVAVKGKINENTVVTVFFTTHPDDALNSDWNVNDFTAQDIVGIRISRKW
jgi:hypothetical protein